MRTTVSILWRFLLVLAFAFWQGGFFFYTSVVVPLAQKTIGGLQQGFITTQVTVVLNVTGAVVLLIFAIDLLVHRRRPAIWACWFGMVLCQAALFWLHPKMDTLLDVESWSVIDREQFRPLHRIYLWVSSVLWGLSLIHFVSVLTLWRRRDFAGRAD